MPDGDIADTVARCSKCGQTVAPVDGYCSNCGAALRAAPGSPADPVALEVRRLRRLVAGIVVALVVAVGAGLVVWQVRSERESEEREQDRFACALAEDRGDLAAIEEFCDD